MPSRVETYTAAMGYRAIRFDPDPRNSPKTERSCARCRKDIPAGSGAGMVYVTGTAMTEVCHPEDIALFEGSVRAGEQHGWVEVGVECVRRFGKEFTRSRDEVMSAEGRLYR